MVAETSSIKLLNRKAVKARIAEEATRVYGDKYSRIATEAYAYLNEELHKLIVEMVSGQDGSGKTIKPPAVEVGD